MHRAAMAVVVGGYAFGGIGTGLGHQLASNTVNHVASHAPIVKDPADMKAADMKAAGMKAVQFRGYEFEVPASWPVYRLDIDPHRCVRYDIHAVYLGTPGTSQNCPARLVGRTETISIGGPAGGNRPAIMIQRATVSAAPAGAGATGAGAAGAGAAGAGAQRTVFQDASQQEFGLPMPASAPPVTATYGADPALIKQVLASVRHIVPQSEPEPKAAPTAHAVPTAPAEPRDAWSDDPPSDWPTPTPNPVSTPTPAPDQAPAQDPASGSAVTSALTLSHGPQAGFDTCTAPSLRAMQAWRARFSVVGVYIGGEEMACGFGNLSASWVQTVRALGWSLLPTYVGPQAPCNTFSGKINMKHAAAQGRQNAQWAVQNAVALGLGRGSPLYYDMEAYNSHKARCVTAVLTFLDAWTRQLNAEGYVSGVYSSAGSGVIDLADTSQVAGHPLAKPQAIWFALWDNASDLDGSPYLPGGTWTALRRSKQFAGSHRVKIGHVKLDIDSDLVSGPVAW